MILGATGKNFGAGMSGGVAYIYDKDDRLKRLVNEDLAGDLFRVESPEVGAVTHIRMSACNPITCPVMLPRHCLVPELASHISNRTELGPEDVLMLVSGVAGRTKML